MKRSWKAGLVMAALMGCALLIPSWTGKAWGGDECHHPASADVQAYVDCVIEYASIDFGDVNDGLHGCSLQPQQCDIVPSLLETVKTKPKPPGKHCKATDAQRDDVIAYLNGVLLSDCGDNFITFNIISDPADPADDDAEETGSADLPPPSKDGGVEVDDVSTGPDAFPAEIDPLDDGVPSVPATLSPEVLLHYTGSGGCSLSAAVGAPAGSALAPLLWLAPIALLRRRERQG